MNDDDNEDGIEFDGAIIMFDNEYDIAGAVGFILAQVTELASDGAEDQNETSQRMLATLLAAAVECAHGRGLSEEEFGDAIVASWVDFENSTERPEGETLN